ncbi:hypothetical protein KTE30_34515 [Burkholderia gladioli]|nr:hypothetical protein [Burkholderia gladioli]MBU9192763.1 hypothetical protein [Burkholderia gladioli]
MVSRFDGTSNLGGRTPLVVKTAYDLLYPGCVGIISRLTGGCVRRNAISGKHGLYAKCRRKKCGGIEIAAATRSASVRAACLS